MCKRKLLIPNESLQILSVLHRSTWVETANGARLVVVVVILIGGGDGGGGGGGGGSDVSGGASSQLLLLAWTIPWVGHLGEGLDLDQQKRKSLSLGLGLDPATHLTQ